jgi:hypothetical protein
MLVCSADDRKDIWCTIRGFSVIERGDAIVGISFTSNTWVST